MTKPKYNKQTRDLVFKLYASGEPIERIAKAQDVSKTTIYAWKKKYEWEDRAKKIQQKTDERLNESLTEIKLRQRQIIKATLAKYIKDLQSEKVDISASEIAKIMNHELLLVGEPTERIEEQIDIGRMLDKISKFRKKKNE